MAQNKIINRSTLDLSIRIFTAFFVAVYGLGKLVQFDGASTTQKVVSDLSGMELMWAFFGYSLAYPLLIGFIQISGAVMLVFERTKLIASLLLTPVFFNIIFLDVVYEVRQGALVNAIVFQLVFTVIIIQQRSKIMVAVKNLTLPAHTFDTRLQRFTKFLIASVMGAALFFLYTYVQRSIS